MEILTTDIIEKIKNDFKQEDWKIVFEELNRILIDSLNVGSIQLIRSIIQLSEGNRYKILNYRNDKYLGDPRDIIMQANNKNPESNFGLNPFDIEYKKKGWITEFWTTDKNISKEEKLLIDKWMYSQLFTSDQFQLKPKIDNELIVVQHSKLTGKTLLELLKPNTPFHKLPDKKILETAIYKTLKENRLRTDCYTISFNQSHTYKYDRGVIGEYEFENKENHEVGDGKLHPLLINLFNESIGNSYSSNYALGTGIVAKDLSWYLIIHFKNEKETYIETLLGGQNEITDSIHSEVKDYL